MMDASTIAAAKLKEANISGNDVREAFFEKISEKEKIIFASNVKSAAESTSPRTEILT